MTMHSSQTLGRKPDALVTGRAAGGRQDAASRTAARTRAEAMQKSGTRLIAAGFVITIVGIVLYCVACFAGGVDAELGDIMFRNSVPFARATLGVLALGTLVWFFGSVQYLRGAMDAEEEDAEQKGSSGR